MSTTVAPTTADTTDVPVAAWIAVGVGAWLLIVGIAMAIRMLLGDRGGGGCPEVCETCDCCASCQRDCLTFASSVENCLPEACRGNAPCSEKCAACCGCGSCDCMCCSGICSECAQCCDCGGCCKDCGASCSQCCSECARDFTSISFNDCGCQDCRADCGNCCDCQCQAPQCDTIACCCCEINIAPRART
eukprot:m.83681 g.83681  ORF g.83681 m.83681 type:complete len:190 (+) comp8312_c0_seq1:155-724(+)